MLIVNHFAYLDAGTGSLIVQAIVGAIAGVAVFGRKLIANIRYKVSHLFRGGNAAEPEQPEKTKRTATK